MRTGYRFYTRVGEGDRLDDRRVDERGNMKVPPSDWWWVVTVVILYFTAVTVMIRRGLWMKPIGRHFVLASLCAMIMSIPAAELGGGYPAAALAAVNVVLFCWIGGPERPSTGRHAAGQKNIAT